ncbi:unnamed protein product [Kuraishia capsulata CBS 1993]|uniref:2-dehydropantoate 2-reductase n=1 Tax=Kuraishia capsulata CBS 1993 TaxID=1382522 RepID=W6MHC8_9ASCO|nr:uncharacterized protein KUCA_T00001025001 [Kuraishia capsulata CBS 1993]CDK25058.1 unnamed protein product [Kuraishia capsulata CBS 1993]
MTKTKVLLIGLGGVGTIAAYGLEFEGKSEVSAVVRSDYDLVKNKGYVIESCDYGHIDSYKPSHVYRNIDEAVRQGPYDYVVVSTKNIPDAYPVEASIGKAYTEGVTTIVLLQNGFGIEKPLLQMLPGATVLSGVSMISSTLYHGVVNHENDDLVKFGVFYNGVTPREQQEASCHRFLELYSNSKNKATYDPDVKYTRWRKLIYNATLNSACALTNVDVGRLELFGGIESVAKPAMREIIAIALSDGVELSPADMDVMIESDNGIWYSPSMLVDVRKGNLIENQVILGNALDVARENGIEAPTLTVLYNLLSIVQMRTKEEKKFFELPERRPDPGYKIEY